MSHALDNFNCLDELAQVIYQSIYKFVVLSTVADNKWNIYVGLSGTQGRWWHGFWTEEDIHRIFVRAVHFFFFAEDGMLLGCISVLIGFARHLGL